MEETIRYEPGAGLEHKRLADIMIGIPVFWYLNATDQRYRKKEKIRKFTSFKIRKRRKTGQKYLFTSKQSLLLDFQWNEAYDAERGEVLLVVTVVY